jgi:hypothetical protein
VLSLTSEEFHECKLPMTLHMHIPTSRLSFIFLLQFSFLFFAFFERALAMNVKQKRLEKQQQKIFA